MNLYQKMYLALFNAVTDALRQMNQQNYGFAQSILIQAQQQAEEQYMELCDGAN